jgi:selenocysteine lyase/cysteine desulfurase
MAPIPCQRDLFDIPRDVAYFNCAYMSPLLKSAVEAGEKGLRRKARPWEIRPSHFFDESDRVRGLFARLIGASPDDVAIVPSASYGLATAMRNVRVAAGQAIVALAEDFPSAALACRALVAREEARLVTVARPGDGDWTSAVLEAIDGSTALVCAPHVHWVCGSVIDLEAVARRCRSVGAALVLDTTQSTGALPLDLAAVDPDYLVATSYKWLLGPYSLGFLYVPPRHQQGRPLEESWMSRLGAEDFRRLAAQEDALAPNARRFDMGEKSNFAAMPAAGAAIAQLLDWGVADICETLAAKTEAIEAQLSQMGMRASPRRAPHYLALSFPAAPPDGIAERLAAAGVHASLRGDWLRITPHLYNDEEDIERLVREVREAVAQRV